MQIEIMGLVEDKTAQKRDDNRQTERTNNEFREKLAKAKAAYKQKAKKRAYNQAAEKYSAKRRLESAMIQAMETERLRSIKAVNFENIREGTKKGPMM